MAGIYEMQDDGAPSLKDSTMLLSAWSPLRALGFRCRSCLDLHACRGLEPKQQSVVERPGFNTATRSGLQRPRAVDARVFSAGIDRNSPDFVLNLPKLAGSSQLHHLD